MKKLIFLAIGILAFALQNASAQWPPAGNSETLPYPTYVPGWVDLFTTTNDFTGWSGQWGNPDPSPSDAYTYDNDINNGAGNPSGGTGTAGSLQVHVPGWQAWTLLADAPGGLAYNQAFMTALDPGSVAGTYTVPWSGYIKMAYSLPDNEGGSYFQLGILLQYPGNGGWATFFDSGSRDTGTTDINGWEVYEAIIPYTMNAGTLDYLTFGILYNGDYKSLDPTYIDDIEVLVPEPSTVALTGMGLLGLAFWARRRK